MDRYCIAPEHSTLHYGVDYITVQYFYVQIIQGSQQRQMSHFIYFIIRLCLVIIILIPVLVFVHSFASQKNYTTVSYYSVCMFTVLSIILYLLLYNSVKNPNKQLFISITLANMLIKMVCSIALLLIYRAVQQPADGKFIVPFLIIYLIFTIFETWFMIRLADKKH